MKVVAKVHIMVGVYFYILPCREKKIEYEEYSHLVQIYRWSERNNLFHVTYFDMAVLLKVDIFKNFETNNLTVYV